MNVAYTEAPSMLISCRSKGCNGDPGFEPSNCHDTGNIALAPGQGRRIASPNTALINLRSASFGKEGGFSGKTTRI